jgi:hypothetical protein
LPFLLIKRDRQTKQKPRKKSNVLNQLHFLINCIRLQFTAYLAATLPLGAAAAGAPVAAARAVFKRSNSFTWASTVALSAPAALLSRTSDPWAPMRASSSVTGSDANLPWFKYQCQAIIATN